MVNHSVPDDWARRSVSFINNEDWDGLNDSCPECDGTEFIKRHLGGDIIRIQTTYDEDGEEAGTHPFPVQDLDGFRQTMFVRCNDCETVLFKHPACDLISEIDPVNQ